MTRSLFRMVPWLAWTAAAAFSLTVGCLAMAQDKPAPAAGDVTKIDGKDMDSCMGCHSEDMSFTIKAVNRKALGESPHKGMTCQDCHTSVDGAPHTAGMMKEKAACADCHSDEAEKLSHSAHSRPDLQKGDHPTCVTCHGGGDPHAVKAVKSWSRPEIVALCSGCHSQTDRMNRYRVDPDAVPSYEESFHGKAILRFHQTKAAICTDCHGAHVMLSPLNPKSNVNRANADSICSKAACHPGAKANFAMSGANHMRLKMKQSVVLLGIYYFFRALTFGMIAFMLMGVGLDIRRKVFGQQKPRSGRLVGFTISLAYILVLVALLLGVFGQANAASSVGVVSFTMLALAYIGYFLRKKNGNGHPTGKTYQRFTVAQRVQHVWLMLGFTTLIATGLPMRFYNVHWLANLYLPFGGLPNARIAHRVAAIALILVFLWHTGDLFIKWVRTGFKFRAMTMLPSRKDAQDFVGHFRHHFGLIQDEPRYDRFQFKQKMDYMAEYWGIPLMVVTGFIQWFPIYWGNRLPEVGLSAALVAHSWEATLAFLAIITWHIYNEHFNPDAFPMSKVWLTGTLTREEMEREHPLELERLDAAEVVEEPVVEAAVVEVPEPESEPLESE